MRAFLLIALIALAALSQFGGGVGVLPIGPAVSEVVYVYEQREHPIPAGVMAGINRLNREQKIVATIFDKDSKNGNGETPKQYVKPLQWATEAGLPSLVVVGGGSLRRVVKDPKTEEQVVEAAK